MQLQKMNVKAVMVPFSDDGDLFEVGDTVAFDGYDWISGTSGTAYIGIIRAIAGTDAMIEYMDPMTFTPNGQTCIRPLSACREYNMPGSQDMKDGMSQMGVDGKSARIEIVSSPRTEADNATEYKAVSGLATQSVNGRTVDGIAAVTGNVDDADDITHKGAFTKTLRERGNRVMFTWNHEIDGFPTARIDDVKEIGRDELPVQVKSKYPEATGGLFVRRTYLETPRGDEAFIGVTSGAIREMSYGYQATKKDFTKYEGKSIRNLREVRLIDICDTPLGVNPASMAVKSALSFHDGPLAPKDTEWDGPAEMAKADVDQLKNMCAWVDSEHADTKGAYKFPYKTADGKIVFKAAAAGMARLNQADIPEGDRAKVYNVLAKVYRKFDEEPPEQKSLEIIWSVADARKLLLSGVDFKAGRMISAANEAKLRDVIDAITNQLETLEQLLGTAEPPADDTEGKALTDASAMLALLDLELIDLETK